MERGKKNETKPDKYGLQITCQEVQIANPHQRNSQIIILDFFNNRQSPKRKDFNPNTGFYYFGEQIFRQ